MESSLLVEKISHWLHEKKALDIVCLDLRKRQLIWDFMVVASGSSSRQVASLADYVSKNLKDLTEKPIYVEGIKEAEWVLIDALDVTIHIFKPETRNYYNIEKIWEGDFTAIDESRVSIL